MNSVEIALKMELDAIEFYTKCAEKTTSPIGKKMFLSIADDERHHVACANKVVRGLGFEPSKTTPKQNIKTIFEKNKKTISHKVTATTDDLEALTIAMQMEKEGVEFYRKAAAEASTPEEKALFECLIKDEEEHYAIFENSYSLLSDTSNWFMWDEHAIYEG
jgi:rubrerythrin